MSGNSFRIELIIIQEGNNKHILLEKNELNFTHDLKNGEKYNVKERGLHKLKRNFRTRIRDRFKKIKGHFLIFFYKDDPNPIEEKIVLSRSPYLIKKAFRSKILKTSLKKEFQSPLELKKILLIAICIISGIVVYFVMTGGSFQL